MRLLDTYCGSIVNCSTMTIVNSSNSEVALGSGVSGAIRDACGDVVFQRECREALEEHADGYLAPGDVIVTSGGQSQYRWILHAATIDFNKGPYISQDVVRKCMVNSLKSSEKLIDENGLDEFSLGVPLLGSDVGGLSIRESCEAMCEGMKIYFRGCQDSLINEICFVHPDDDVIRQVKLTLGRHFVLQ